MVPEENIYRPDCQTISTGEFYKRLDMDITYFGNVEGVGYVEAYSTWSIKVYHNQQLLNTFTLKEIQTLLVLAEEETSEGNAPQLLTGIGLALALSSFAAEMKLQIEDYNQLVRFIKNGQFPGYKNGQLIMMDKSYLSTARIKTIRGIEQVKFLEKVDKLGWVKKTGKYLSYAGIFLSGAQWYNADTEREKIEYGVDTTMGFIGLTGLWGAAISLNYSIYKPLYPSVVKDNIERGERLSKGDFSMWWKPGRSIR